MKLRHTDVWSAIDRLAKKHKLSVSGLARKAGLDPTAFNKSKRHAPDTGKPRWPSTETVEKLLCATGERWPEFVRLMGKRAL
jgi:phage repressor protein C with HTH and peptisase S24 domain